MFSLEYKYTILNTICWRYNDERWELKTWKHINYTTTHLLWYLKHTFIMVSIIIGMWEKICYKCSTWHIGIAYDTICWTFRVENWELNPWRDTNCMTTYFGIMVNHTLNIVSIMIIIWKKICYKCSFWDIIITYLNKISFSKSSYIILLSIKRLGMA